MTSQIEAVFGQRRKVTEAPIEWWTDYQADPSDANRDRLIEHYLPAVRWVAEQLNRKLPDAVELGDLFSEGVFGLMEAIDNYDLSRSVKFKTYCTMRIRGSILDQLRKQDWVPRLVRTKASQLEKARAELEALLVGEPSDVQMAEHLGMNMSEFAELVRGGTPVDVVSADTMTVPCPNSEREESLLSVVINVRAENPSENAERNSDMEHIASILDERERLILLLYYFEEMTMREIGEILDLSESRVCQLHSRMLRRLGRELPELAES